MRYWLGSIHTYSSREAPVILALTHAEDNGADPKKVRSWKVSTLFNMGALLSLKNSRSNSFMLMTQMTTFSVLALKYITQYNNCHIKKQYPLRECN